ncbi:hypothetical protein niasHS_001969 [Heterodera schachtii]|uniref:Uncharacterized protein n=1 Tax=Heterodera schachtii TaxID=97005 RepID=A0ABD2K5G3_HETSC
MNLWLFEICEKHNAKNVYNKQSLVTHWQSVLFWASLANSFVEALRLAGLIHPVISMGAQAACSPVCQCQEPSLNCQNLFLKNIILRWRSKF